jgi:hypothetical protein
MLRPLVLLLIPVAVAGCAHHAQTSPAEVSRPEQLNRVPVPAAVSDVIFRESTAVALRIQPGETVRLANNVESIVQFAGIQQASGGLAGALMRDGVLQALFARCCRLAGPDETPLLERLDGKRAAYLTVKLDTASDAYQSLNLHMPWLDPERGRRPVVITGFLPTDAPDALKSWVDSRVTDLAEPLVATRAHTDYLQISAMLPIRSDPTASKDPPPAAALRAASSGEFLDARTLSSPAFQSFAAPTQRSDTDADLSGYIHVTNLSRLAVAWSHYARSPDPVTVARPTARPSSLKNQHRIEAASRVARAASDHLQQTSPSHREMRDYSLHLRSTADWLFDLSVVGSLEHRRADDTRRRQLTPPAQPDERTLVRLFASLPPTEELQSPPTDAVTKFSRRWNRYELSIGTPFIYAAARPFAHVEALRQTFGNLFSGTTPTSVVSHLRRTREQTGNRLPVYGGLALLSNRAIDRSLREHLAQLRHLTSVELTSETVEVNGVERLLRVGFNQSHRSADEESTPEVGKRSQTSDGHVPSLSIDVDIQAIVHILNRAIGEALPGGVRQRASKLGDVLGRISGVLHRGDASIHGSLVAGASDGWPQLSVEATPASTDDSTHEKRSNPTCISEVRRAASDLTVAVHTRVESAANLRRGVDYPGKPTEALEDTIDTVETCNGRGVISDSLSEFAVRRARWMATRPAAAFLESRRGWQTACDRGDMSACEILGRFGPTELEAARSDLETRID